MLTQRGDSLRLWDAVTGEPVARLGRPGEVVAGYKFGGDGRLVLARAATFRADDDPVEEELQHGPGRHRRVGTLGAGGLRSFPTTVNEPRVELPAASAAVQDTVWVPTTTTKPGAGLQRTATGPSIASTAETSFEYENAEPIAAVTGELGTVRTGPVRSVATTENDALALFPAASVAVQSTTCDPTGKAVPDGGVQDTETLASTLSIARTDLSNENGTPAEAVKGRVGTVKAGLVRSLTFTWNDPRTVVPPESVTSQRTSVLPSANFEPESGKQETASLESIRSAAVAGGYFAHVPDASTAETVTSSGTVSLGGPSKTRTEKDRTAMRPWASFAVHTTVVVVIGKVAPELGEHAASTLPLTRSVADTEYATAAPVRDVASRTMPAGMRRTGGVESRTVMEKAPAVRRPRASVAEHSTFDAPSGNSEPELGLQVDLSGATPSRAVTEYST